MSLTMRAPTPSSRASLNIRISYFDAFWALVAPMLALFFRDAYILSYQGALTTVLYCFLAASFSMVGFLIFRLRDQMAQYFSVHDAIDVVKAVLFAEFMNVIVLFTFTRLEGIPRSTPLIHALVLAAGLIAARTFVRLFHSDGVVAKGQASNASEHIIMIGATRLSSLYIKIVDTYFRGRHKVIGVLDVRPRMVGRTISGVRVIGSPHDLKSIIDEFAVHGIQASRIIYGGDGGYLPEFVLEKIERVCDERNIRLDFVSKLIGLDDLSASFHESPLSPAESAASPEESTAPNFASRPYFQFRRYFDFVAAMAMTIILLPQFVFVSIVALLDVGYPVLFWQQRIGQGGRAFLIYKFRTLRAPFDRFGRPVPEQQRLSWVGALLRRMRLDELPQLLNVLVGDMSLIGPRPLLPEDQPQESDARIMVRPGITGWAQVNGGTALTPKEKGALDEWYVHNASLWLDFRIMMMTIRYLMIGRDVRSFRALAASRALRSSRAKEFKRRSIVASTPIRHQYAASGKDSDVQLARGE